MSVMLSLSEARRRAIASQGFSARPSTSSIPHLRKLTVRLHASEIDSVNGLVAGTFVPAFARFGPYGIECLDSLAYRKRELVKCWGHEARLLPIPPYSLVRYRMLKDTDQTQEFMRPKQDRYMAQVFAEVAERGPITATELSNPCKRCDGWWGWRGSGNGRAMLDHLYRPGHEVHAG
jgi:uncharacterized protein